MNFLKVLINRESKSTADELEQIVQTATDEAAKAEQALTAARDAYLESRFAADPSETSKAHAGVTRAEIARDRAAAHAELAGQRHEEAKRRDADVERKRRYEEAERLAADARKALQGYSALAREIVDLIETVAKAEAAVSEANVDSPASAEPIPSPEQTLAQKMLRAG